MMEWDKGIDDFEEILRREPEFPDVHHGLGRIHLWRGDMDAAMAALNRAVTLHPRSAKLFVFRAILHEKSGDADLAEKDRETAMKLDPSLTPGRSRVAVNRVIPGHARGAQRD